LINRIQKGETKMVKQIIKEAMDKNPIGLKEAVEIELMKRLGVALQERGKPKIGCLKCDAVSTQAAWEKNGGVCPKCKVSSQGVAESLQESFKRGDIVEVPGAGSSTHKAVMLSNSKAVYLEDDGSVEPVPSSVLQRVSKAKRVSKNEKDLAKEYLSNMKEDTDLEESA
jgi:hypothetical protein